MQKIFNTHLQNYYSELEIINSVKFTSREIDIIPWLISGKTNKTAASFLSISLKTLETHTQNIMRKTECNSRERIINFIEKSGKAETVRKFYNFFLLESEFKKCLEKISALIKEERTIYYYHTFKKQIIFQNIKKDFDTLGVELIEVNPYNLDQNFINNKKNTSPICLIDKKENIPNEIKEIIVILFDENTSNSNGKTACKNICVNFEIKDYYFSFFKILENLLPIENFKNIIEEFNVQYKILTKNSPAKEFLFSSPTKENLTNLNINHNNTLTNILKRKSVLLMTSILFFLSICIFLFFIMPENKTIYSGLVIPHESVFLKRIEILKTIKEKLKEKPNIQVIALTGIGGAGKTTIARQYAQKQNANIIWEINAEKENSLIDSFESLAYALAKTNEDKKILKELQEINNYKERIEKILSFTKERLKTHKNWLLIYDNVENFSIIQKYFPTDSKIWGNGKIIITTKDSNIAGNSYINHVVFINELNREEKFNLFMNIVTHGNTYTLLPKQKNVIYNFLDKLPPFPLDISTAAYYLKATNIYLSEYLERLDKNDLDFNNTQENIIRESTDYNNTRQKIISLTLKKLININQDFKDLLLFISLLNSQDIPRELLDKLKPPLVVDSFIYNLKKYSFITNQSSMSSSTLCFSIHRSMQAISLSCLNKTNELNNHELIRLISYTLNKYTNNIINNEDFLRFKIIKNHCETFLSHNYASNKILDKEIESQLGCIYFYIGDYTRAKQVLEESLNNLNKNDKLNYPQFTQILSYLGMISKEQGNYKKAQEFLEHALTLYRKYIPENYVGMAKTLSYLGITYKSLRDYKKAEELLDQALTLYRKHIPENYVGIARVLSYLGINYREQGNYEKAKEFLEESLMIYQKYLPENLTFIAQALSYLGIVYVELGHYKKARNLLEESINTYKRYLPENHVNLAVNLMHLGYSYRELGDYKKAINLLEESIIIYKKYISENNVDLALAFSYLAESHRETGNYKRAKNLFLESIQMLKTNLGENHIDIASVLALLGHIYTQEGNYIKAKEIIEESLAIHIKNLPENHIDTAWVLALLGDVCGYLKYYDKANEYFEKSLAVYKQHFEFEKGHVKMGWFFSYLGNFYKNMGEYEKAKKTFEEGLKIYEKNFGKNHIETMKLLKNLGQVYLLEKNIEFAEQYIRKALEVFYNNQHSDSYICLECLAQIYLIKSLKLNNNVKQSSNLKKQAFEFLTKALEVIKTYYPEDSPHIARIEANLKKIKHF